MQDLRRYLSGHAEQCFVLTILVGVACINYFVPYKLIYLNFFFLVVLIGAYHLDLRKAVLGGILCSLMVTVHVYYFPSNFAQTLTELDLWMAVLAWSCFLVLTGAVVGGLTSRLKTRLEELQTAQQELESFYGSRVVDTIPIEQLEISVGQDSAVPASRGF